MPALTKNMKKDWKRLWFALKFELVSEDNVSRIVRFTKSEMKKQVIRGISKLTLLGSYGI